MIGKIIGAIAGSHASKHVQGLNGSGGALLGVAVPTLLRRLSPLSLIAVAAGGYAYKKYADRREADKLERARPSGFAEPTRTQA
ncbi:MULTISPECIES: hypothetical protein [Sphingomonadaceae]|uniref:Uncharacterized protein n=1 Tax=Novosphingobium guangzhouense TaxID=1850347 RepID=A0A2K2FXV9_9SPHN|nr:MULTISPECIES: hypothetical protein [Sphingomonadaceae]PNU03603.1 hypothetical protein A8V01_23540 [Novosphingobium guangzhouense]